jgi:hypothetical protein
MNRFAFLAAGVLWLWCFAPARAERPLYQEDRYDEITLDAANNNAVVKIHPLPVPGRMPPPRGKPSDKLVVHLIKPDEVREVLWLHIVKLELFEELVLKKANELTAEGRFEQAYDYFVFLQADQPSLPGLADSIDRYLYEEAKACQLNGQFDGALALLRELRERNPRRSGLDKALGRTTDELVGLRVKEQNYVAARTLLHNLAANYPEHPVVAQWRNRLSRQSAPLLAEAKTAAEAGQWSKASDLTRQVAAVWPELAGAREFALSIHQKYPRVVVGVGTLATDIVPSHLDDWTARRTSRLLFRTLTEFAGASTEGGKYECPVGEVSTADMGRRLAVRVKMGIGWANGSATLTNSDVARRLLTMADPSNSAYRIEWADLMMAVSTRGIDRLEVELRRPHVRPEAMLQIVLTPRGLSPKGGEPLPVNGPFVVGSRSPQETVFVANPHYFAAETGQPKEIVERRYPRSPKRSRRSSGARFTRWIASIPGT